MYWGEKALVVAPLVLVLLMLMVLVRVAALFVFWGVHLAGSRGFLFQPPPPPKQQTTNKKL